MRYEDKIAEYGDYEVIIRTSSDLLDETEREKFNFISNRISEILEQIELHDDYEQLLIDQKRLNKIADILIDKMREDSEKRNDFEHDYRCSTDEETCPFI